MRDKQDGCPSQYYCGSSYRSIWMNSRHPSEQEGIVSRQLCYRDRYNCCSRRQDIRVRKCPGGYYVYYLPPATSCSATFCSATEYNNPCLNSECQYNCTKLSSSRYRCTCPSGQIMSSTEKDKCVEPCEEAGCSYNCTSELRNVKCICSDHYILGTDDKTCVSKPCSSNKSNCSHTCKVVSKYNYTCWCPEGYVLKEDRHTCTVDECYTDNGGCSHTCTRLQYSDGPTCSCPTDMELDLDKETCIEFIDHCMINNPCSSNATCTSKNGVGQCLCKIGYVGDGFTCKGDPCFKYEELDQKWRKFGSGGGQHCDKPGNPGAHAGGYNKWFRVTGEAGNRIYDKTDGTSRYGQCGSRYSIWINGYHKTVPAGKDTYMPLCAHDNSYPCSTNYGAVGLGVMIRRCPGGYLIYYLPEAYSCLATFCTVGDTSDPCLISSCEYKCLNVIGGKGKCVCPSHLALHDGKCLPLCEVNNGGCSHTCNRHTSKCSCPLHLTLDPSDEKNCINPCSLNHGRCSHYCLNHPKKGVVCSCPKNMILDIDGQECVEGLCQHKTLNCSHTCRDVSKNISVCECPTGMELMSDKVTCSLNKCHIDNGGCSHQCNRPRFSNIHTCSCPDRFDLELDGKTCLEKCADNLCSENATCTSTDSGVSCQCKDGYIGNGLACEVSAPTEADKDVQLPSCRCQMYASGTDRFGRGPHLYDLPTLYYGDKHIWLQLKGGMATINRIYPAFQSSQHRFGKRSVRRNRLIDQKKCLKLLQHCATDCENLAKMILKKGLSTKFSFTGSSRRTFMKSLGQIMCERLHEHVASPGLRPVVFYNPGNCGRKTSTYFMDEHLCCKSVNVDEIDDFIIWNKKCSHSITPLKWLQGLLSKL